MKKFLALIVILLAILLALLNFVLPGTVAQILEEQIVNATAAQDVDVILSSNPNAKVALGEIEKVHATASNATFGEMNFKNLALDGEKVSINVTELLIPSKNLTANERMHKVLKHADKIELRGTVTEDELRNFIASKESKLESPTVKIYHDEVKASARTKFLGRNVDLDVAGIFTVNNGDVLFHMTRLDSNAILRRVNLDVLLGDVKILDSSILPLGLRFDAVEMRDGEVVVTAVRR